MPIKSLKEIDEVIDHKGSRIPYKIIFSKRRSLLITVYHDRSVKVRAPRKASIKYVKNFVEKKADWIISRQEKFKDYKPKKARRFENGESYNFLGKKYYLQVVFDLVNKVEIEGENLLIRVVKFNERKIRKLIDEWFCENAKKIFIERMEIYKLLALDIGIKYNGTPKFRKMKSRWGSCSRKGEITLSYELAKAPLESVDYVILHELCHIREFNHSRSFYALLDKTMPDWKERKNKLKGLREDYCE